jgi:hypothetical protein
MLSLSLIATSGLIAGVVMTVAAGLLQAVHFTTLDLTKYFGCFFTRRNSGPACFAAGFAFHMILSVICPFAYMLILYHLNQPLTLLNGLYVGLAHTFVTGSILPIVDRLNGCVRQGAVPAMGFCAVNYGVTGFITWLAGHVIFSVAIFVVLIQYR